MRRSSLLRPVEVIAAWLLLVALQATAAAQTRIVAIGDVHGALPEFESILKETGLLEAKRGASGGWAGGRTVLVQLGDLVDRGPKTRACLDLVMELRDSEGSRYTVRDTPIFTCILKDIKGTLDTLGG